MKMPENTLINKKVLQHLQALDNSSKLEGKKQNKYGWDDIEIIGQLGKGGFGTVYEVDIIQQEHHEQEQRRQRHDDVDDDDDCCSYSSNSSIIGPFALKHVDVQTAKSRRDLVVGATDLVSEANILSDLDHPNVIKLHGICSSTLSTSFVEGNGQGYFILLEILQDTLKERIDRWKIENLQSNYAKGSRYHHTSRHQLKRERKEMLQRIEHVIMGVVSGMEYLHEQNIILRDLKPENVGFGNDGNVKIFDLGLARNVNEYDDHEVAGTFRYMAPEVMMGQCSGRPSDVYTFGLLLWEVCTLKLPYYEFMDRDELRYHVVSEHYRPTTCTIPDEEIRNLIKQCWHYDYSLRPTFTEIKEKLTKIFGADANDDKKKLSLSKHKKSKDSSSSSSSQQLQLITLFHKISKFKNRSPGLVRDNSNNNNENNKYIYVLS